jgi:hypothetical protein
MAAPEKEMNNCYTEIWESTIAYKDDFWANEPGHRTRRDRDIVAPRPGIFPITTRSRRCQLHPMHSKKRNVAACRHPHAQLQDTKYNYSSQHDRHQRECRPSTTRPKSRQISEKTGPSASRHHRLKWHWDGRKAEANYSDANISSIEAAPQEIPKPT